jgi:hypothetical protein
LILTLIEEYGLRVFVNRMLRRRFGARRDKVTGGGENCMTRRFITCTLQRVKLG